MLFRLLPKWRDSEVLRPIPFSILGFQNRDGDCSANYPRNGSPTWTRTKSNRLTAGRATLTLQGNIAAGRNCTCMIAVTVSPA